MKTFDAKVTYENGKKRFIPGCTIHKGKLVQIVKKGVGTPVEKGGFGPGGDGEVWEEYPEYVDTYKALVNGDLLDENNISQEEVKRLLEEDSENAFSDERIFNSLMVLGENKGGKVVVNYTEEREQKELEELETYEAGIRNKDEKIEFENGIFGLRLVRRIPRDIWQEIKGCADYHRGDDSDQEWAEDMGYIEPHISEIKGWFYSELAVEKLLSAGYRVSYRGHEIKIVSDIDRVNKEIADQEQRYRDARKAYNAEKDSLLSELREFNVAGDLISEQESKTVSKLDQIHFSNLDITGANIYGAGSWLHKDSDHLYIVKNNGMDGDDWSRNNYGTGGAGAICSKIKLTEKVKSWLDRAGDFESKNIEDYIQSK